MLRKQGKKTQNLQTNKNKLDYSFKPVEVELDDRLDGVCGGVGAIPSPGDV